MLPVLSFMQQFLVDNMSCCKKVHSSCGVESFKYKYRLYTKDLIKSLGSCPSYQTLLVFLEALNYCSIYKVYSQSLQPQKWPYMTTNCGDAENYCLATEA